VFTALQTIQENIDKQSPHSASLVLKFSDLLSYILYENDEAFVALNKEIEVIDAYLVLEKENHGDNVALTITKNGNFLGLQVVPLLLLPLVESCFEHSFIGEENVAINVDFSHDGVILLLRLNVRNLPQHGDRITQQSKTIKSVIQRLQSCYRDRHQIDIHTIDNNYELRLSLNLN
jgi:LytS/YehU family sensor histidine kinase